MASSFGHLDPILFVLGGLVALSTTLLQDVPWLSSDGNVESFKRCCMVLGMRTMSPTPLFRHTSVFPSLLTFPHVLGSAGTCVPKY